MPVTSNRQIVLAARPNGRAKLTDFQTIEQPIPVLTDGQVLFRNTLVSIDPYQRNLMGNASSELPPIELGQPMPGPTVAVIEQSKNPSFAVGEQVASWSGWQEYGVSDGSDLRKLDPAAAPVSTALSVLGHTGLSAWVGTTRFLKPKPGGIFVVTAAAGSVGSVAAQIAKLRGHRVVGIAGGANKTAFLRDELGLDAVVDYKADGFADQLARALPDGIDTLFDNVGGYMFEALMPFFNQRAQIVICGAIAQYDNPGPGPGPDYLPELLTLFLYRFLEIRSFSLPDHLNDYPAFLAEVGPWVADGKIKFAEHFVDGFEAIPEAFLGLFDGRNHGKLIARVGEQND
jgi:NADPH-dependent curcumin reductase CurA